MHAPSALGRSAVVGPGESAPAEWSSCPRIRVASVERAIADELGAAWRDRRPLVIELMPGVGLDDPTVPPLEVVTDRQPWEWPVDLDLVGERLHHAVWANSVDARGRSSGAPWRWAARACELGAAPAKHGEVDVVLPDATPAYCDGGPLDATLAERTGSAIVHRISLDHGMLRPLGPNDPGRCALAPDQLEAVTERGAGARIIAPAGSGKTRVLTERARLLLGTMGLPPAAVAMVAYNTRAANEMKERLHDLDVRVRTLNALGLRLCGNRSTVEEVEVRRVLSGLVSFPKRAETDPAAPWIQALSRVRLGLADPSVVEDELPDVSGLNQVARSYRSLLAERGVVDFDEQVTGSIERLLADPAFRARTQRFARVLLVDEFQDLTPAHLLLIRLVTGPAGSVFAVGDDDQTIYGYAGATPRWLVDFDRWFPGSATHALDVNYRCPPPVVAAAGNLLTRNAVRVHKTIRAAPMAHAGSPQALGQMEPLSVCSGEDGPATRAARRVRELLDAGAEPKDVAVLARVNASLAPVQVILRSSGIPVQGGVGLPFLQRGGVRAALAWLTAASVPSGIVPGPVLREAARRPKRGFSASLLELVGRKGSVGELTGLAGWLEAKGSDREAGKVEDLAGDLALAQRVAGRGSTADVLGVLRARIGEGGLDASATALDQWSRAAGAAHGDDLNALAELAELQDDPEEFPIWIADQLGIPSDSDGVTLASIHAVKGREWPHVVVHHATGGLIPHRLAEDVEEERRVFHVALTRCQSSVSIVPGSPASPFVAELARPGKPAPSPAPGATPSGRPSRRPEPAASDSRSRRAAATEVLPATVGSRFTHRGHEHEVIELTSSGVRCLVGGGPATTTIAFGTSVDAGGRALVLGHPLFDEARDRLRAWRSGRSAGKPAYVVFDDKTLSLIAAVLPTNEAGLLAISGIGQVKLESYGDELISIAEQVRAG